MNTTLILVACLATAVSPEVEVTSLSGATVMGSLKSIDSDSLFLEGLKGSSEMKRGDLLSIRFSASKKKRRLKGTKVLLRDGSSLLCSEVSILGKSSQLKSYAIGATSLRMNQIRSIQFGRMDQARAADWKKLMSRELRDDLLVIRKKEGLDFLSGVVGDVNDKAVQFLMNDNSISVKRAKVFGIIYQSEAPVMKKLPLKFHFSTGEEVAASSFKFNGSHFDIQHVVGEVKGVSSNLILEVDLSAGKLKYLSDLDPHRVEYSACIGSTQKEDFDPVFEYRKDLNMYGNPIRLGKTIYRKGVCLHSETTLTYRLAKEYKKFQAIVGIDASAGNADGNVQLTIVGDGVQIYNANVLGTGSPVKIDIDVSPYRMIEIKVGCGPDGWDLGDNLNFGNARLLK